MKLIKLSIQNFMGIEASEDDFGGAPVVAFEGANGSGKTSRLRAIQALFAGGKAIPDIPIKRGAKKAQIIGETETLVCTRTFSKSGTKLEIRPNEAGAVKMSKPQQVLDALIGLFLDPLEFDLMDAKKRAAVLREIAGLDLSALEERRKKIEEERRDVGRDKKKSEGALAKIPAAANDDDSEAMSASEILAEIGARDQRNDNRNSQREKLKSMRGNATELITERDAMGDRVAELGAALQSATEELEEIGFRIEALRKDGKQFAAVVEKLTPNESTDDLKARLADAEKVAARASEIARRAELELEARGYASQYDQLTGELDAIAEERAGAIADATYPVPGLEAQDDGVYLDGVPWDQANASRRIIASTAMGFALHPELKIICVENASLLDEESRAAMLKTAVECGGQAFLEVVGWGKEVSVVIESKDGGT